MRRLLAVVLAHALVASAAGASPLHVHEYVGHDHPEHHHGPATHEHEHSTRVDRAHHSSEAIVHGPEIESQSCDPGRHAVSIRMACARVAQVQVDLAELPGPVVGAPAAPARSSVPVTDVRVHGPPFDPRIPSRAPPASLHA